MTARYVEYDSPGGNSGRMRGYLVKPVGDGPFPAVLVIHENRGLNPHIEDVARRAAIDGFLALAPDGLAPAGGYPGDDDDGKQLQRSLDRGKLHVNFFNSARFLKSHALSNGKLGTTGFCWGGGTVNYLAVEMGGDLHAAVPFYGAAPKSGIDRIKAPLLVQYAENDGRNNAMRQGFEAAPQRRPGQARLAAHDRVLQGEFGVDTNGIQPSSRHPRAVRDADLLRLRP
jgi:carboxymethylenebutenolidase